MNDPGESSCQVPLLQAEVLFLSSLNAVSFIRFPGYSGCLINNDEGF